MLAYLTAPNPEDVAQVKERHTGRYLHQVLTRSRRHRVGQWLGERSSPAA